MAEQNPNENAGQGSNVPNPDPSLLSTQQVEREIEHLRELIEARVDNMVRQAETKAAEQAKAVDAALVAANKAVQELDASITRRMVSIVELTDAKFGGIGKEFVTYKTLLDSATNQTQAALAAADKAVAAAFASSSAAIAKAESFNEKRFDLLTQQIDELKTYRDASQGKGVGQASVVAFVFSGVGLIAAIIAIVIALGGGP